MATKHSKIEWGFMFSNLWRNYVLIGIGWENICLDGDSHDQHKADGIQFFFQVLGFGVWLSLYNK